MSATSTTAARLRYATLLASAWAVASTLSASADETLSELTEARRAYDAAIASALKDRQDAGDAAGEAWLHQRSIPRHLGRTLVYVPTAWERDPVKTPAGEWATTVVQTGEDSAARVFAEAKRIAQDEPPGAYALLHETLFLDPNHAEARRILGWKLVGKQWRQGKPKATAKPAKNDHKDLGWRRGQHWVVDTDHFHVVTDHSPKAGLDLAYDLELLHEAWSQLFFDFWGDPAALVGRFDGKATLLAKEAQHQVVLCKSRDEYLKQLSAAPDAAVSAGIYLDEKRISLFYAGEGSQATWRHEAVHQLFDERRRGPKPPVGRERDAWAIEGIALYFESLRFRGAIGQVGGFDAERLQYARMRALSGDFFMPGAQIYDLGRDALQKHPDVRKIYTQIGGLAHYLMDGDDASRRSGWLRYLQAVYAGKREQSLAEATGHEGDAAKLDDGYRAFLQVDSATLASCPPHPETTILWLGATALRGRDCAVLSRATLLKELDLSGTLIDNQGLAAIAGLKSLESLTLIQCRDVGDEGLAKLAACAKLTALDVTDTSVTSAGAADLRKRLPKLTITGP